MKTWFARSMTRLGHLSDETIAKLISGELSSYREFRAKAHLNNCWQCKARRETLEKASFQVVEYRKLQLERCLPLNPRRRQEFFKRLDEVWDEASVPTWRSRLSAYFGTLPASLMNPIFASTFVVCMAVALLFLIWHRNSAPMSSQAFLAKAMQAESQQEAATTTGVIYQKVQLRVGTKTMEHAIYRDASRKRRPRPLALTAAERSVQTELATSGVNWERPLSAHDYTDWHEQQTAVRDEVRASGEGLLTLTSIVPSGPVASESLTVRVADFHPIQRTVAMRDAETIEIAEVHYDVLGWDAVNNALFEPLGPPPTASAIGSVLRALPSEEELDLAELQARLVLNRLHADSTEQLEFLRSRSSVEVKGVVESNARKQELIAQLRTVPHVVLAIFSVDDLRTQGEGDSTASSVRAYSTVGQASPLEQFFRAQGKGTDTLNATSQQLLDAALSVKQESSAIAELYQRFGNNAQLDEAGKSTLQQLLDAHASHLQQAVDTEDRILVETVMTRPAALQAWSALEGTRSLLAPAASRNLDLCKELISGSDGSQRDATLIASDLFHVTQQLRNSLHSIASNKSTSGQAAIPTSEKR